MEIPQPEPAQEQGSTGLYRERVSSENYLEKSLEEIGRLAKGEGVLELTEAERSSLLTYESGFEEKFHEIWLTKIRSMSLDIDWLSTEDGRSFFAEKTGLTHLPLKSESWPHFLYQNTENIAKLDPKVRKIISGEGKDYRDAKLLEQFSGGIQEDGTLSPGEIEYTERLSLLFDPEKWVVKNNELRELKQNLKAEYKELKEDSSESAEAKRLILNLYMHRVNISITSLFDERRTVAQKALRLGLDSLSDAEKEVLGNDYSQAQIDQGQAPFVTDRTYRERQSARLDKFSYGASHETTDGERRQIGTELEKVAERLGEVWLHNTVSKKELVEAKGINYEQLFKDDITPEERKASIEKHMAILGILSSDTEYNPDREGPAEDNKFQVYIRPGAKTAAVNQKQWVQILSAEESNAASLLAIDNGHELAHVLQTLNSAQIPLKIFERVGGGGSSAFSEGGAMYVQNKISRQLFGYEAANHPHYIKAMAARLNGSIFPDVVKVFHDSAIQPYQILLKRGRITESEFRDKARAILKEAVSRCQRLFSGSKLDSEGTHLTESRATVYLEQNVVFEKLAGRGLEKAFLLRGMSLENIITLLKLGYLKMDEIKEPDYRFIEEEWQKIKSKYELNPGPTN